MIDPNDTGYTLTIHGQRFELTEDELDELFEAIVELSAREVLDTMVGRFFSGRLH